MKTQLQKHLQTLAPSISIVTLWGDDHAPDWEIFEDGNGLDGESPDEWQCWQSEVRATAICGGEEVTGSAYLGGIWERAGDNPAESNPEISGYELQMTLEALEELMGGIPAGSGYLKEFTAALDYLEAPGYAVRARNGSGYLATQGREYWFEEKPVGWALYTTEGSARDAMERCHSALGTSTPEGGEIVYA